MWVRFSRWAFIMDLHRSRYPSLAPQTRPCHATNCLWPPVGAWSAPPSAGVAGGPHITSSGPPGDAGPPVQGVAGKSGNQGTVLPSGRSSLGWHSSSQWRDMGAGPSAGLFPRTSPAAPKTTTSHQSSMRTELASHWPLLPLPSRSRTTPSSPSGRPSLLWRLLLRPTLMLLLVVESRSGRAGSPPPSHFLVRISASSTPSTLIASPRRHRGIRLPPSPLLLEQLVMLSSPRLPASRPSGRFWSPTSRTPIPRHIGGPSSMVSPIVRLLWTTWRLSLRRRSTVASQLCARAWSRHLPPLFAPCWSLFLRRMIISSAILSKLSRLPFICSHCRLSSPRRRRRHLVVFLLPTHAAVRLALLLFHVRPRLPPPPPSLPPPPARGKRRAALHAEARAVLGNDFRRLFLLPLLWPRQWGEGLDISFMCGRISALLPPYWTLWKVSSSLSAVHHRSPFLLRRLSRSSRGKITWISSTRKWRRCRGRGP